MMILVILIETITMITLMMTMMMTMMMKIGKTIHTDYR